LYDAKFRVFHGKVRYRKINKNVVHVIDQRGEGAEISSEGLTIMQFREISTSENFPLYGKQRLKSLHNA
jgi:hypothetical protein